MPTIAVALHLFNLALLPEFRDYLFNISAAGFSYDLYIAVLKGSDYSAVKRAFPKAIIAERENRGFDMASFLVSCEAIFQQPYDYILKLHSKNNDEWRRQLINPLLGSPARVRHCMNLFADPTVGMVGAEHWIIPIGRDWGNNTTYIKSISNEWAVPVQPCNFIGGTIFWIRYATLKAAARGVDLGQIARSLNTSTSVDWVWYLMMYPELRSVGVRDARTADEHWERQGRREGRACNCLYARINKLKTAFCDGMKEHAYERFFGLVVSAAQQRVAGVGGSSLLASKKISTLALYHPQFEWSAVRSNAHGVQPHADVGYYNSHDKAVISKQLDMMSKYGIDGVCYCVSPTTSHFLREVPTTFPFCFSWTMGTVINLQQLQPLFTHKNYIRVGNKPLIYLDTSIARTGLGAFEVIDTTLILPKTHNLQYRGIVLGDQTRNFSKELYEVYNRLLAEPTNKPQYLVLNAWNDWQHQLALEPSRAHGYGLLKELKSVMLYFA